MLSLIPSKPSSCQSERFALIQPTVSTVAPICIVGCGIAGLYAALLLADAGQSVLLITKSQGTESNSRYAQGGIAAVLPNNPEDSLERHVQDTLQAGAGLCEETAVRSLLSEGYAAVEDLLRYGVPFDRAPNGSLALTKEAAHSVRRIIHAGGDATGASVENQLLQQVHAHPRITRLEQTLVLDLVRHDDGTLAGLTVWSSAQPVAHVLPAQAVILATGGIGQLYRQTTNPVIATGDGLAMAVRAGLPLQDMEFVQFHPTALFAQGNARFLVSEALRGEGGRLVTADGTRFAQAYHPDGELAPRDVVTRALFMESQRQDSDHLFLDMRHLRAEYLRKRFPTIDQACRHWGVDFTRQPIPVAPAAHYCMGGIPVDTNGQSRLPGLWVIGESARTGLHGANRLASNSLLECLVLARRAAHQIASQAQPVHNALVPVLGDLPVLRSMEPSLFLEQRLAALRALMWEKVGIVRTQAGLMQAIEALSLWQQEARVKGLLTQGATGWEYGNLLTVGLAIAQAALARPTSIGAHFMQQPACSLS